jgi:hypothetical protein
MLEPPIDMIGFLLKISIEVTNLNDQKSCSLINMHKSFREFYGKTYMLDELSYFWFEKP